MNFPRTPSRRAFTLVELLVAVTVLFLVMVVLLQLTGGVAEIWRSSMGKISAFQNGRAAFTTVSRTLSRATLNTYNDYVDASGNYRNASNAADFSPTQFSRASELQFLCGPAAQIVPGAQASTNPGGAIFFQAPMGETEQSDLKNLDHTVNSTGFYIQYGSPDDSIVPDWLKPMIGETKRFRLIQSVDPAEDTEGIYASTASANYDLTWMQAFKTPADPASQPRARVLAEDVPLIVFRPKLAPSDEQAVAGLLGGSAPGSVLCPNYQYDSRAWQPGYPAGQRVKAASSPAARAKIMRNQVPPIVDIAMVCLDRNSLNRLDLSGDNPPSALQVPSTLFTDSSRLEADLETYGKQLSEAGIRYRIFRTSVPIQGAKWSNN